MIEFDLQLFAAPEDEGRTEQPTPRKLHRARQHGMVPHSVELSGTVVTLITLFLLSFIGYYIFTQSYSLIHYNLIQLPIPDTSYLADIIWNNFLVFIKLVLPILIVAAVVALASELFQVGLHFSIYQLRFDLARLKLDLKRLLSRLFPVSLRSIFEYARTFIKVIAISYFTYDVIVKNYRNILLLPEMSLGDALHFISGLAYKLCLMVAVLLLVMSLIDYLIARRDYKRQLMMSRHELLEELKQTEGDPLVRARLREEHRRRARRMMADLLTADVVITNPVHIAVALKYDPTIMPAPMVVAKGKGTLAERIIEIAKLHQIPIVENKPLAEALYEAVEIGQVIKEEFYNAVAEVLAFVYRLKNKI